MSTRYKEAREYIGLSTTQVASILEVEHDTIERFEAGRLSPTPAEMLGLSQLFQRSPSYLRGDPQAAPQRTGESAGMAYVPADPLVSIDPVAILYTNHRGETAVRRIVPRDWWFGSTEWHPEPGWLLTADEPDTGKRRDFALSGIRAWGRAAVEAAFGQAGEVERLRADRDRLDFLDHCNAALNAKYGIHYRWRLTLNHNVSRLMLGGMVDLHDSEGGNAGLPSCRAAIDERRHEHRAPDPGQGAGER